MSTYTLPRRPILPEDYLPLDTALVPDIYRYAGLHYGERAFAAVLHDDSGVVEEITWRQLLRDSERVATWLRKEAPDLPASTTVGLLGTSGYMYYTYMVAMFLNGWVPLVLSTRNSVAANAHLLTAVKAPILVSDPAFASPARAVKDELPVLQVIPYAPDDFSAESVPVPSPADAETVAKTVHTPVIYMHTSGSTGHPKPVSMTHRHFFDRVKLRSAKMFIGSPAYVPFPVFHGFGIYIFCQWPLGSGVVPTFVEMRKPLTGEAVVRHLAILPDAFTVLAPSVLEEVAELDERSIHVLTRARRVFYAGAPLREEVGNSLVRRGVPLGAACGMSEIGLLSILSYPTPDTVKDWGYLRLREDAYTLHMVPWPDSDLRHLVISPTAIITPAVINHDDPVGYATKDLWQEHPVYPGVWKHCGRADSVTVLSNGEKTDDEQLVKLLLRDTRIARAVVFGTAKMYNGVLVQPTPAYEGAKDYVDIIWPSIEKANAVIPKHSRIMRHMIVVAHPNKPFALTDKETARKKDTLTLYESEIAAAYEKQDAGDFSEDGSATESGPELRERLRGTVVRALGKKVSDDDDLFDLGCDSLHAFELRSAVTRAIRGSGSASSLVPANVVYTHPTISQLTDFILSRRTGSPALAPRSKRERVRESIERFSAGFQQRTASQGTPEPTENQVVVVTGTTGSLGSHVLARLLASPNIRKVYCLLRGANILVKQAEALDTRGIDSNILEFYSEKLKLCSWDMARLDLGLSAGIAQEIRDEATHIIHLAWNLNFNWDFARFEKTHVTGTRGLIDLALSSNRPSPPRMVFMSSIGAVLNAHSDEPVPERLFDDPEISDGGYGEAKFVSEHLLRRASAAGLKSTIIRAAQLSGSTVNGSWSSTEYFPVLVKNSLALGVAPESLPPLRWLPVDVAADATLTLSLKPDTDVAIYHLENPTPVPWPTVLSVLAATTQTPLKFVSGEQWLRAVEDRSGGGVDGMRAAALLPFYANFLRSADSWTVLDTRKAAAAGANLGGMTEEVLAKYMEWIVDHQ